MITLGIDVGSNSVGSAWVDTDAHELDLGVSVFPAGVEEREDKRGAPVGQNRRNKRLQRRTIARRASRKRHLRQILSAHGLFPVDAREFRKLFEDSVNNPWQLRRRALDHELTPHEFGRVLYHLAQRRGALGIEADSDDPDAGKVKLGIEHIRETMRRHNARTVGELMAELMDERCHRLSKSSSGHYQDAVRNRRGSYEFQATRSMISEEFALLWEIQSQFESTLSPLLTDELRVQLDDSQGDDTWQHRGAIFGQRRTYWNTGTLGRCDLEPTDRCAPIADRWASHFRVVETVNNIRFRERGGEWQPLTPDQRDKVIAMLEKESKGTVAKVRRTLGLHTKDKKEFVRLNIENDAQREINTDWFCREVVINTIGRDAWGLMSDPTRESINKAILKFDPDWPNDEVELREGAAEWWGLDEECIEKLIVAWRSRPRLEKRLSLSRRAVCNLLPYMETPDADGHWLTQIEARRRFAEDGANEATAEQRERYTLGPNRPSKRLRHYASKHPDRLPPPPMLSNPVVRKAIYAVRNHIEAYLRRYGKVPDRVVIELVREARQSGRVRNDILARNRAREKVRKDIAEQFGLVGLPRHQRRAAEDRVILCRQQREICAYTGETITEAQAARNDNLEIDHIVPWSRSGDDSLNNKVLCYRRANRDKGNNTPREWLNDKTFNDLITRFERVLLEQPVPNTYFRRKDAQRKLDNLRREIREESAWRHSQLTDTAYAAKQVADYLQQALYHDEQGDTANNRRRIFFTRGQYTAILRKDWQLFEQGVGMKSRDDHRHHAIDALVIALTDDNRLQLLSLAAKEQEVRGQSWRDRSPVPPPWSNGTDFRRQVLSRVFGNFSQTDGGTGGLVVCHRPIKRRLTGPLHKETAYGPVVGSDDMFVGRIEIADLKPKHLRMPDGWEELDKRMRQDGLSEPERRQVRRERNRLVDPPPGKSSLVRDRDLRAALRNALRSRGLNSDEFSSKQLKDALSKGELCLPSGVPILHVKLLRVYRKAVKIAGKRWDDEQRRYVKDEDPRRLRVYESQNNHHVEIRNSNGKWVGSLITTFDAAQRVRKEKLPAVDRGDNGAGSFVMSLSEGETVRMREASGIGAVDYFVVAKLDSAKAIQFVRHNDARDSKHRQLIKRSPEELHSLRAVKVRLDPLGEITELIRD